MKCRPSARFSIDTKIESAVALFLKTHFTKSFISYDIYSIFNFLARNKAAVASCTRQLSNSASELSSFNISFELLGFQRGVN